MTSPSNMKDIITKQYFGILALLIALIPQVAHTVYVYSENGHYSDPWFAWCYAIAVDLAILIFTVRGWIWTALAYLLVTLAHNLAYQFLPKGIESSILIAVTQSATIFSFSHVFYVARKKRNRNDITLEPAKLELVKRIISMMESGIYFEPQPYHCPACTCRYPTAKKLNGHISGHKMRNEWQADQYGNWEGENRERADKLAQLNASDMNPASNI